MLGRIVFPFLVLGVAGGCTHSTLRVAQYGGMREVLQEGKADRRIELPSAVARPHAYGVGALENLGGEITIIDGDVWIGRVQGGSLQVTGPRPSNADGAALLVLAHVDRWTQTPLGAAAADGELESALEQIARRQRVDTSKPFPFVIEGQLTALTLHVVNGACPMSGGHGAGDSGVPWRSTFDAPASGYIVGFFANDSAGQITHHGTRIHAHALLERNGVRITGHVERLAVGPGAVIRLPASLLGRREKSAGH